MRNKKTKPYFCICTPVPTNLFYDIYIYTYNSIMMLYLKIEFNYKSEFCRTLFKYINNKKQAAKINVE